MAEVLLCIFCLLLMTIGATWVKSKASYLLAVVAVSIAVTILYLNEFIDGNFYVVITLVILSVSLVTRERFEQIGKNDFS